MYPAITSVTSREAFQLVAAEAENLLQKQGENKDLSLKHLSLKLMMLMSLTSASRVSELQALDLRFRTVSTL